MSWNNRIFKHNTEYGIFYGLHETYYDEDGNVEGYTSVALTGLFETIEELKSDLEYKLNDVNRFLDEILEYANEE